MSTWFEPDDEIARRLEHSLRQEAEAMSIPPKFDQIGDAARAGGRRRTARTIIGVAAGVTAIALAGGWAATQNTVLRGTPQPAGPLPVATASASPTATPSAAPTGTPAPQRTPAQVTGSHLGFASPTGNLVCIMDAVGGVRCHAIQATWSGKDIPATKLQNCGTAPFGDFGPGQDVILTSSGAFGSCVSQLSVLPAFVTTDGRPNTDRPEYRTWAGRDATQVEVLPGLKAWVLPYGTTAVTGWFACTMADTGITCSDTTGSAGFHLSRAELTLR